MLSGISLLCFTASYGVALALEVTRLMFRSGIRGAVMLLFAAAGFTAHTLYLVAQAMETAPATLPLSNWYHWYLLAAWLLALVYLYLTFYHPHNPIGLFLLPLVLLLIAAAYYVRNDASPPATQARTVWLWVHVLGFLLGTVTVFIGFATGVMYLAQSWRLKHKLPASSRLTLPSLEWLQTATARSLVVSMLLVGVGVVGGLIRNYHLLRSSSGGLRWSDPTIWSSAVLLGWLVAAVAFNALYRPSREGRKVAYLTVASFGFLVLTLAVTLLIPEAHTKVGYAQRTNLAARLNHRDTEMQRTHGGEFEQEDAEGAETVCLASSAPSAPSCSQFPFALSSISCFRDPSLCFDVPVAPGIGTLRVPYMGGFP